jgi:curved DNA-binding protein
MNYYKTLGLESNATADEVKQAYRKLAMKHHPDRGGNEAEFKKIKEAYEAITSGKAHTSNFWQQGHTRRGPFNGFEDLQDIIRRTQRGGSWNFDDWREPEVRNPDVNISIPCTLEEAHTGFSKDIAFTMPDGSEKEMKITFPPGSTEDIKIRFAGDGGQLIKDQPPGDLYAKIKIEPHKFWHLAHHDLHATIRISVWQAMFGSEVEITDIAGSVIQISIPAGSQPGSQLRLRNRGFNVRGTSAKGNAFITLEVHIPKLNPEDQDKMVIDLQAEK